MTMRFSLREHKTYVSGSYNPNWTFAKQDATTLRQTSTTSSMGSGYFFVTINRAWLNGKYIRFNWAGYRTGGSGATWTVYIMDGSYDRSSNVDFPTGAGKLIKGNGLLQTLASKTANFIAGETVDVLVNILGGSQSDCTIFFELADGYNGQGFWEQTDWFEINTAAAGVGNLVTEHFTDTVHMELTGTYGDYGYISTGGITVPTVATSAATGIAQHQADLHGNITDCGADPTCDERGFDWGTEVGVYTDDWTESDAYGTGVFNHIEAGLLIGQTYYFRAKAHNSIGWGYGSEYSFTTLGTPEVETDDATGVDYNIATLNGEVTDVGVGCTERGFEWGEDSGIYFHSWTETGTFSAEAYDHILTYLNDWLLPDSTYYYRAKAKSASGWGYGEEKVFVTLEGTLEGFGVVLVADTVPSATYLPLTYVLSWREVQRCGVPRKDIPLRTDGQVVEDEVYTLEARTITFTVRLDAFSRDILNNIRDLNMRLSITTDYGWSYDGWLRDIKDDYEYRNGEEWLITIEFDTDNFRYIAP